MRHYARNIGDWSAATAHLTDTEEVVYLRLTDAYYLREQPLPLDIAMVRRMARARTPQAIRAVQTVLDQFFSKGPDGWRQKRCDAEITRWHDKSDAARASIGRRWERSGASKSALRSDLERNVVNGKNTSKNNTRAHTDVDTDVILPTNHEPIQHQKQDQKLRRTPVAATPLPGWMPSIAWHAFLQSRVAMRARATPHAEQLLLRELDKLRQQGHDPASVLNQSIARGWRGLFPLKTDSSVPAGNRHQARSTFANETLGATGDDHHEKPADNADPLDITAEAVRIA